VSNEPIVYPQPADNTITFAYTLSARSGVKIFVYNLVGAQVAVFEQAAGAAGINTAECDVSKLSPGIYFYIIKAPDSGVKFKVNKFMIKK
jgi:hypothetical protein